MQCFRKRLTIAMSSNYKLAAWTDSLYNIPRRVIVFSATYIQLQTVIRTV